ncbi:MAG: hypothetical protein IT443_11500 [Phycisphaeraceae bacterium]|nr:hypothetical protein [Phycisphaeraceae bacterium]
MPTTPFHRFRWPTLAASLVLLVAGCAGPGKTQKSATVFYPPAPDEPRLQFLMSFNDAQALIGKGSSFSQFVVGGEKDVIGPIGNPYGLAMQNSRIYICDLANRKVRVIDMPTKTYSELGASGLMKNPVNITLLPDGTKFVCDTGNRLVYEFNAQDRLVKTLGDAKRCAPISLAVDRQGNLYVADVDNGRIEVWSRSGELQKTISSKGSGPDQLKLPTNLAVGPDGLIYVTDTDQQLVKVFSPQGKLVRTIGEPGDRPGYFARPKGIIIDPQGRVYVADSQWEQVQMFAPDGRLLMYFGGVTTGPESMGLPAGVAIDQTSIPAFQSYIDPGFTPQYLLLVANQFGEHKVGVYAFGHRKGQPPATAPSDLPPVQTTQPAATQPTTP